MTSTTATAVRVMSSVVSMCERLVGCSSFRRSLAAWTTNASADIAGLFTPDAEYHDVGYDTEWTGRDEIVASWQSRFEWQSGGWTFDWTLNAIVGDTASITGTGHYAALGEFGKIWVVTFEGDRCSMFRMWNFEI